MDGYKRTLKNRETIREDVRLDVLKVYLVNSGGVLPKQQCEETRGDAWTKQLVWWLEPLLPDHDNGAVIEEEKLDGQWTIRIDPIFKPTRVFT